LVSRTKIYVIPLGESLPGAQKVAEKLRGKNVNVEVDISNRKVEKQIKAAIKKKIPYLLFVGEEELKSGEYTLKNVKTEKEQKLSIEKVVQAIT
ncbi:hypothetical protein KC939_02295, partial [Candidatus Saccharibacteria bacterium]|nr:hypothetical protein [Candidatus Saccharibacteria bacterium]